ncbi:hypothetical protein [Actinomadura gamaensis]|uniref:Uncharacterized protein n=1 Tax=Actinomadura gamaensis TaxID=1763541 RepID=A0ABV9UA02_9ACTN
MNDKPLLDELRVAFERLDPVPDDVLAAGRSALTWRDPDADLAELTDERDHGLVGARGAGNAGSAGSAASEGGAGGPRLLTFRASGRTVELQVSGTGRDLALSGRLAPASAADIRLRHPHTDELFARADETGCFVLTAVPDGLISLVFHLPDASCVVTSWIRL